ncbi:Fur-regulated basic protein FbpA [Neobacillus cucumis]|nr:Fur-regulated basic protein FbpA [Neobacillus cucumis]MDR4950332.1 Fur-regulated basic protein FbpA [Neobacillus cucumis]
MKSGIYKRGNKHLYELTLSDLENEYKYIEKNSSDRNKRWNPNPL